jgi:hypothetical protein
MTYFFLRKKHYFAALFARPTKGKQPKCPWMGERIMKESQWRPKGNPGSLQEVQLQQRGVREPEQVGSEVGPPLAGQRIDLE